MEWFQVAGPGAFLAISIGLLLSVLRYRSAEIEGMKADLHAQRLENVALREEAQGRDRRITAVENENRDCRLTQAKLVAVLYSNNLTVPEGIL